ncbi:hypothetical protein [Methylotuvimicrobium alcaliphilum]|uniref:hypothetical protein n=1 Tax=Methylotuvimicrobium alcaliphilum TaxID=271065 RepID=UPI0013923F49|nr:hypothetical protein [Methylotuvimicrobium alcaliphilum]
MKKPSSPRQMKVRGGTEGAVTRPTGRRKYVHVGSTAARSPRKARMQILQEQKSALPPTPVGRTTAPSPEAALVLSSAVYRKIR